MRLLQRRRRATHGNAFRRGPNPPYGGTSIMVVHRHRPPVLHVVVRFRHDCPFSRISAKYPDVPFTQWCNNRVEVLEVRTDDPARAAALREDLAALDAQGYHPVASGDDTSHIVMTCGHPTTGTVEDRIQQHGCLVLQPIHYHGGWEQYRVVVFEEERMPALFAELQRDGEVEIVKKRRTQGPFLDGGLLLSSGDIVGDLTPRQGKALSQAVAAGYYQVPRRTRFQDIAESAGLPRTTFEEHVRKAEAKVIRAVAPYLKTVQGSGPTRRSPPRLP